MMRILLTLLILLFPIAASAVEQPKLVTNLDKKVDYGLYENYHGKADDLLAGKVLEGNVYDLSFVAYDKGFADEFGLIDDNITEMDEHLRFMEIKMITEGRRTNCYYNVILDKDVKLDFPENDYYKKKMNPSLNLPANRSSPRENTKKRIALYTHNTWKNSKKYSNRTYVGNRGYIHNKKGSKGQGILQYYISNRSPDYNILSTKYSCYFSAHVFNDGIPALWIAKETGEFGHYVNAPKKKFQLFTIPVTISNKLKPILNFYKQSQQKGK